MITLIHYGELFLKGKNRRFFEEKLISNIQDATGGSAQKLQGRMILEGGDPGQLKYVPGIQWYAPAHRVEKEVDAIRECVLKELEDRAASSPTFAIIATRADKHFPMSSMELAKLMGGYVVEKFGLNVNLTDPQLSVYIEIADKCYIHFERIVGIAGLPVGSSGRVLCLLSGGIDSPVAAFSMMKRGCKVDFLHFHAFPSNDAIEDSKIVEIVRILNKFQHSSRLYVVPYAPFQLELFAESIGKGYEMVLFRRFFLRLAERVAVAAGYKALVTGDSVGQVASQTLENLAAAYGAVSIPVLHPLIAFNKTEIIDLARQIGTYETSIEPYKDCCSIIVSNPKTKVTLEKAEVIERRIDLDKVLELTREQASVWDITHDGQVLKAVDS